MEQRTCTRCKGTGEGYHWDHEKAAGNPPRPCWSCEGRGHFDPPDVQAIVAALKGRKGLCSKRPKDARAYFVWRMARFHGGADVTMPMTASMEIGGDPFDKELDDLASGIAKRVYGTDLAAAHRWGRLLGHIPTDIEIPGLPSTAYESGPVLAFGATKPDEERPELDPPADDDPWADPELADPC